MSNEYPSEAALEKIKVWPIGDKFDWHPLMEYVESEWWAADWGWHRMGNTYRVSTGGWSGNEELISAMQANYMFWSMCWVSSRRGGHFVFRVPKIKTRSPKPEEPRG